MTLRHMMLALVLPLFALTACELPQGLTEQQASKLNQSDVHRFLTAGKFRMDAKVVNRDYHNIEKTEVYIDQITIKNEEGGTYLYNVGRLSLDLMRFSESASQALMKVLIPEGRYVEVRLHVAELGSLTLKDGTVLPLRIPSGEQSGLKIFFDQSFIVRNDMLTSSLAVFDVAESFVFPGHGNWVIFKPVLRVGVEDPVVIVTPPDTGTGTGSDTGTGTGSDTGTGTGSDTGTGTGSDTGTGTGSDWIIWA